MLCKFFMKGLSHRVISRLLAVGILLPAPGMTRGATVPDKPVYPPHIYFVQASLNKSGTVSAIQGEDNFMRLFVPAMDTSEHAIPADGLTCKLLLPEGVTLLPEPELPLEIKKTTVEGQPMQVVSFTLPKEGVTKSQNIPANRARLEISLWYRVDGLRAGENYPIRLSLEMQGKTCFTDEAKLHVYEALKAITPIDPNIFRFWLHYGPFFQRGKWDELATRLRHYGINTVQVINHDVEQAKAMKDRGFSVIAHRLGNYLKTHHPGTAVSDNVAQGPEWFEKEDAGAMEKILPYVDVVTWDFEPDPRKIVTDDMTLELFRKFAKIPAGEKLDEQAIKEKYMNPWIAFRQKQFAALIKNWADWSRSMKGDVKTLVSEGTVRTFDPSRQIDYRNYANAVTYIDPMSFSGPLAVRGMRQWKAVTPDGVFTGCQNVAQNARSPVTVSANTIMLSTASAALMGNVGTGIYPGQTMDAENFVKFNRVMGFLGENQEIIWKGTTQPKEMILALLPKQDETITLATGDTLRNVYPNWDNDAVAQTYKSKSGDAYFFGIVNWHANEPCYAKIQVEGLSGKWMLTDDESRRVYTYGGKAELDAADLARGAIVSVPSSDYRGFRAAHFDANAIGDYEQVALEETAKEFSRYSDASGAEKKVADQAGGIRIDYDDIDGDKVVEYLVTTASQKVWISQAGCIVRWQAGGASLDGALGRDQLWLPVGERGNAFTDAAMTLESRQIDKDHAEIVLSRTVALASLGSMMDFHMTKKFTISNRRGEIAVETTIRNHSLAAQNASFELSYRVHNRMQSDGEVTVWADDGAALAALDPIPRFFVPGAGLDARSLELLSPGTQYTQFPARKLAAFGDYQPKEKTLLAFVPEKADDLLQMLRWLSKDGRLGSIDWMYRPVKLGGGESWKAAYRMHLEGNASSPNHAAVEKLLSFSQSQPKP